MAVKQGTKVLIPATVTAMDSNGEFVVVLLDRPNKNHANGTEVGGLHVSQVDENEDADLQAADEGAAKPLERTQPQPPLTMKRID
jgi:hypothetical protein